MIVLDASVIAKWFLEVISIIFSVDLDLKIKFYILTFLRM